ncbi:hypothetical protein ANTRET_LOCUS6991 [Anthophora retusa]
MDKYRSYDQICERTTYNLPSFSRPKILGRASQWSSFLGGTSHHARHLCHRDSPGTNSGAIAKNESSETYLCLLENYLSSAEVAAWNSFKLIVSDFLGNNNSPNYEMIVEDLLQKYATIGINMSLKIHFLQSHLNLFQENLGDISDEHGERFHQEMKTIDWPYQEFLDERMMGDYMWSLIRETDSKNNRRQSRSQNYF